MGRAVLFPVPCEVAYDYLVAPDNRAEWQSTRPIDSRSSSQ